MSGHARSKVNLHLTNCRELGRMAEIHGADNSLASSVCLQFEMALGFYLVEIFRALGKKSFQLWPVSEESLNTLLRQFDGADLNELVGLAGAGDSWLNRMLRRLELLRQMDSPRAIKAEIFRSDLEAPGLLIASSAGQVEPSFEMQAILADVEEFESLVNRQRLGHEEY